MSDLLERRPQNGTQNGQKDGQQGLQEKSTEGGLPASSDQPQEIFVREKMRRIVRNRNKRTARY